MKSGIDNWTGKYSKKSFATLLQELADAWPFDMKIGLLSKVFMDSHFWLKYSMYLTWKMFQWMFHVMCSLQVTFIYIGTYISVFNTKESMVNKQANMIIIWTISGPFLNGQSCYPTPSVLCAGVSLDILKLTFIFSHIKINWTEWVSL